MKFTHNFQEDLQTLLTAIDNREPVALTRFADGELNFLCGRKVNTSADGWKYNGQDTPFALDIRKAVTANLDNYFLGLSCFCCDPASANWYFSHVPTPHERITFSNVMVNANRNKFTERYDERQWERDSVIVGCTDVAHIRIPRNAINPHFDYTDTLHEMAESPATRIFVAGGPMSCVLIHQYWINEDFPRKTLIDIGSTMDRRLRGRPTRKYHRPGTPTSKKVCSCLVPPQYASAPGPS
jgi:hypothetical protein